MDIELSTEQKYLFNVMENTKNHIFVTGKAGAGKSVLLRHFRENTTKRVVVAAPTGIAALNIKGQTLHSLFRVAPQLHRPGSLTPNSRVCSLLKRIDTLVIDEISMVRADLLDAVDERLREACHNDKPFGGKQIIMFGDCYQLPPVVEQGLVPYFESVHGGYYFFNALVWQKAEFTIYELTQIFRQKDPIFKDILNAVRDGTVVDAQIEQLNARHGAAPTSDEVVTLAPTNSLVTEINQRRLDQLEGNARQYSASISGEMKKSTFPTEEVLHLKKDAQIVMLKNDKDGRWVNGSVGKIDGLFDDHIDVRVGGIVYTLERETWEEIGYTYDIETQEIKMRVGSSFTQYPVRLAWAMTIHKSQGQTYDHVQLDLTTATFAPGQLYVSLSRCTSMEGLSLRVPVKRKDVITDAKVIAFMGRCETIKADEEVVSEEIASETMPVVVLPEQEVIAAVVPVDIHHDEITALVPLVSVQFNHDENVTIVEEMISNATLIQTGIVLDHDEIEGEIILEVNAGIATKQALEEGKVSRIAAIEVLCPACNSQCVDLALESPFITYELVGHTVKCSACGKFCTVPLNAFSLQGDVIAREKPAPGVTNSKAEKKGRTKKERKSAQGRKTKGDTVREPMQLSLDPRTIATLNAMGINKSQLFEDLLEQYEPFLEMRAAVVSEGPDDDGLDHDEIEDEE